MTTAVHGIADVQQPPPEAHRHEFGRCVSSQSAQTVVAARPAGMAKYVGFPEPISVLASVPDLDDAAKPDPTRTASIADVSECPFNSLASQKLELVTSHTSHVPRGLRRRQDASLI